MKFVKLLFLVICASAIVSTATEKDIDRLLSELKPEKKVKKHKKSKHHRKLILPFMGAPYMYMPHMHPMHHMHPYGMGFNPMMTAMMNPAMFGYMNPFFSGMHHPMGLGALNPYFMTHVNPYYMASMNPYLNMWHNPMTYGGIHAMHGYGPRGGVSGRFATKRYLGDKKKELKKNKETKDVNEAKAPEASLKLTSADNKAEEKTPERILMGFKNRIGKKAFEEEMAKVNRDFGLY